MIKGTFWVEEKADGRVLIGVEDYDVEVYGGRDYEWIYTLDVNNKEKMIGILSKTQEGTLEEMIADEFGIHLDKKSMREWFEENKIEFEFFSWIS